MSLLPRPIYNVDSRPGQSVDSVTQRHQPLRVQNPQSSFVFQHCSRSFRDGVSHLAQGDARRALEIGQRKEGWRALMISKRPAAHHTSSPAARSDSDFRNIQGAENDLLERLQRHVRSVQKKKSKLGLGN